MTTLKIRFIRLHIIENKLMPGVRNTLVVCRRHFVSISVGIYVFGDLRLGRQEAPSKRVLMLTKSLGESH
jgi:hypothetical protein